MTAPLTSDGPSSRKLRLALIRKRVAILPTLCTLCNAACGLGALVFAARINVAENFSLDLAMYISGWLIFVAMVFDLFDGFLARRTKTASSFGTELDSLCDAISFGAAPAFLLLRLGASFEERRIKEVFLLVATLYMICVILRLARFNTQTSLDAKSHRAFLGLPSPAAAGCIASLVVLHYNFNEFPRFATDDVVNPIIRWFAPSGAMFLALLMVSRVPYTHAANRILHRRFNFARLVQIILVVFALVLLRELALVLMFWSYALYGPARVLLVRLGFGAPPDNSSGESGAPPSQPTARTG
jgi:CDP-diacylglycerol--serine O-phosphatidyltransferase